MNRLRCSEREIFDIQGRAKRGEKWPKPTWKSLEKLVSRKGHLMELKNVKNPWKASCVVNRFFQTDRSVLV